MCVLVLVCVCVCFSYCAIVLPMAVPILLLVKCCVLSDLLCPRPTSTVSLFRERQTDRQTERGVPLTTSSSTVYSVCTSVPTIQLHAPRCKCTPAPIASYRPVCSGQEAVKVFHTCEHCVWMKLHMLLALIFVGFIT